MTGLSAGGIPGYGHVYGLDGGVGGVGGVAASCGLDMSLCKRVAFTSQPTAPTSTTNSLGYSVSNLLGVQGLTVPTYPIPVGL